MPRYCIMYSKDRCYNECNNIFAHIHAKNDIIKYMLSVKQVIQSHDSFVFLIAKLLAVLCHYVIRSGNYCRYKYVIHNIQKTREQKSVRTHANIHTLYIKKFFIFFRKTCT